MDTAEPILLTYEEVAKRLSLSEGTIRNAVRAKQLMPTYVTPTTPRFHVEEIDRFAREGWSEN